MPRHYVKNPKTGKWNIYSTIIDDFILDEWATFDELKHYAVAEAAEEKRKDIESLKTQSPRVNIMDYDEAIALRAMYQCQDDQQTT